MNNFDQLAQQLWLIRLASVGLALLCAVLLVLGTVGYGTINLAVPSDTTVRINGKQVSSGKLRVHPGSYTVSVVSPIYSGIGENLSVSAFQSKTIDSGFLHKRTPANIVSSVIGASGDYGPPSFYYAHFFQQNTWLVGIIGPGSPTPAVFQYVNHAWTVVYDEALGAYPDISTLPPDVASYLQSLVEINNNG